MSTAIENEERKPVTILTNEQRIANREEAIKRFNLWPKWKRELFTYRRQP